MIQYFALCKFLTMGDRILKTGLKYFFFFPRTGERMTDLIFGLMIVLKCCHWQHMTLAEEKKHMIQIFLIGLKLFFIL